MSPRSAYELAEKAVAQKKLDTNKAANSIVAAAETIHDSVFEDLATPTLAKLPRAKPGPKPKLPKPPQKKPGPKPKAKTQEKEKRVHLTEDEHLTLFRLCNFHAEAYRKTDNVKF
jgi:hypothetical protein